MWDDKRAKGRTDGRKREGGGKLGRREKEKEGSNISNN